MDMRIIILVVVLLVLIAANAALYVYSVQLDADKIDISQLSNFEKGQLYFNHSDDPGGVYDLALAARYYSAAAAEGDTNPLLWYQWGRVDFIEGRFSAALRKFTEQVDLYGNEVPQVHYMLGLTYGFRARDTDSPDDWDMAEAEFSQYIELVPDEPWPYVDLAWVYFSQGKYEQMTPVLERGLAVDQSNAWILNMYGLAIYNSKHNHGAALEMLYRARTSARSLTAEDWGRVYPGNDPKEWGDSLAQFRAVIESNIDLIESDLRRG